MAISTTKQITIEVGLDENAVPEEIRWQAPDAGEKEQQAEAVMLAFFDSGNKTTLGLDLWTKDMLVGDMHIFCYQTLKKMADLIERATQDRDAAELVRQFSREYGKKVKLLR